MYTGQVVLVAILAVTVPVLGRLLFSPLALVVLVPLGVVLLAFLLLTSNILLAYALQTWRSRHSSRRNTQHSAKPLAFSTPAAWQAVLTRSQWSTKENHTQHPLLPSSPDLSSLLDSIITNIIRDFVMVWYESISTSPIFPNTLEDTIYSAAEDIISRLEHLDIPTLLVRRILPQITAHIEKFRQSEIALRGVGLERHLTQSEELDLLLANKYAGRDGKLHPAVENLASPVTKQTEQAHLRGVIERILPYVMPEKEVGSKAVIVVAREILACVVMGPAMEMLSDPDFWNRLIDQAVRSTNKDFYFL